MMNFWDEKTQWLHKYRYDFVHKIKPKIQSQID